MPRYLKANNLKITFREYWYLTHSLNVLIPWICKLFRIRLPLVRGLAEPTSFRDLKLEEAELSPEVLEKLRGSMAAFQQLGFRTPWFHKDKQSLIPAQSGAVVLLHESGEAVAKVIYVKQTSGTVTIEKLVCAILSPLSNGNILTTGNQRREMLSPPGYETECLLHASPEQLWKRHKEKLEKLRNRHPPRALRSLTEYEAFCDELEIRPFQFHVRRGVYMEMTPEEVEEARKAFYGPAALPAPAPPLLSSSGAQPPPPPGTALLTAAPSPPVPHENAPILAELEKLQHPRKSWASALVIFAVSLALFASVGVLQWEAGFVLLLLLILFIHESGHYLAMKLFNYRNVKMFFIPLFGAAVSGQHLRVEGWKKAVVSLMGPAPGIILGAALSVVAVLFDKPELGKIAFMFLVINGFNLLPLVPLDGGWILNAVLFCRNRWLEAAFKITAGLVLCVFGNSRLLFVIGLLMIFSAPHSLRVGKVAARLREKGFANDSPDTADVSPQAADAIIQEVRAAVPPTARLNAKTIATIALNVYERLHTTVPRVPASIGLLTAYAATLVAALVFAGVALGYRLDNSANFAPAAPIVPQWVYNGERSTKGTLSIAGAAVPPITVIGTFATHAAARQAFEKFEPRSASGEALMTLFGQSLFVTAIAPDADQQMELQKRLSDLTPVVVTENRVSNQMAYVYLQCTARDETSAQTLYSAFDDYLEMPTALFLRAPWAPQGDATEEQKRNERKARNTYRRLLDRELSVHREPRLQQLARQFPQAFQSKDKTALDAVRKEFKEAYDEIRQRELNKLMEGNDPAIDHETAAIYLQRPEGTNVATAEKKWHLELGRRMGQVPLVDDEPSGSDVGTATGFVHRKGSLLKLEMLSFRRTDLGLPALAEFLRNNECANIRYAITNFEADLDADESEK